MPVDFNDFSGGVNFDDLPEEMNINQLQDGQNLDLRWKGIVRGRFADTLAQTFGETIDDCFFQTIFGGGGFITRCGTNLYDGLRLIKSDCLDSKHRFAEYQGYLVFTDGTKNWKWKRAGIKGGFSCGCSCPSDLLFGTDSFFSEIALAVSFFPANSGYYCSFSWEKELLEDGLGSSDALSLATSWVDSDLGGSDLIQFGPVEIGLEEWVGITHEVSYFHPWEQVYDAEAVPESKGEVFAAELDNPAWDVAYESNATITPTFHLQDNPVLYFQTTGASGSAYATENFELSAENDWYINLRLYIVAAGVGARGAGASVYITVGSGEKQLKLEFFSDVVLVNGIPCSAFINYLGVDLDLKLLYRDLAGIWELAIYRDDLLLVDGITSYLNYSAAAGFTAGIANGTSGLTTRMYLKKVWIDHYYASFFTGLDLKKATIECANPTLFTMPLLQCFHIWEKDLMSQVVTGGIGYCHSWEPTLHASFFLPSSVGKVTQTQTKVLLNRIAIKKMEYLYSWESQMLKKTRALPSSLAADSMVNMTAGGSVTAYISQLSAPPRLLGNDDWIAEDNNGFSYLCKYKISFGNADLRYGPAVLFGSGLGPGTVLWPLPISTDPQVTSRWIWRAEPLTATFRLCKIIENNTDLEWIDTVSLGLMTEELVLNHVKPSGCLDLCEHQSLLYMLREPNLVYWPLSYGDWEFYPELNYEPMGSSSRVGSRILTLGQELVCYNDLEIWRYLGAIEDDYVKKLSVSNHTLAAKDSLTSNGTLHILLDHDGIFGFDTSRDIPLDLSLDALFQENSEQTWSFEPGLLSEAKAVFLRDELFIAYARKDALVLNSLLVINTVKKRAMVLPLTGITNILSDPLNHKIYYTKGAEIRELANPPVVGTPVTTWTMTTKNFSVEFGSRFQQKGFRFVKFFCDPGAGSITVSFYVDNSLKKTWTISSGGRQTVRYRIDPSWSGFNCSFIIGGTADSEFYAIALDTALIGF